MSLIAGCGGESERGSQCCARTLQVKVLKGLRRVIVREQTCAAEKQEIQREKIPQAESVVPCTCCFKAASHTNRAEAMTEARVHMQHMHVVFVASTSQFPYVTFSFVGKMQRIYNIKNLQSFIAMACFVCLF